MNTKQLFLMKGDYFSYLEELGMCKNTIWVNKYVINNFEKYCMTNDISTINKDVVKQFYLNSLDYVNKTKNYQYVLKRPILAFLDYCNTGSFLKEYSNKKVEHIIINNDFKKIFNEYKNNILLQSELSNKSVNRKVRVITNLLNNISNMGINKLESLNEQIITTYINRNLNIYSKSTINCYKSIIVEFLSYLHNNNLISFSKKLVTYKSSNSRDIVASSFTTDEVKMILDSIDTSTKHGKHHYLIIVLLAYYGLRVGDIMKLQFKNINFNTNKISLIQSKTKVELVLPLVDEVKFALLDYIKNSRPSNTNNDYILLTIHAPHKEYTNIDAFYTIISRIILNSGISLDDRKNGSRVFRHSLATNMINKNVELYKISNVLGHKSTRTTSKYISRDTNLLKEITLEVNYE